ncbi:MAG: lytic transglycosylase domain-containing protein [Patescibacteria group bacterium]
MKKIVFILVLFLIVFSSFSQAESNFEKWQLGIEETVREVDVIYGERLERAAAEHDHVEKIDLWAKVVVESNGNKLAVSETSVKGLTMLTLDVVELVRRETGIVIDRLHPFEAIWGAGWYLNYLIEKYDFTIDQAHGAYYLGPTGLKNKLKDHGIEDLYHVQKINYVKEIIKNNY